MEEKRLPEAPEATEAADPATEETPTRKLPARYNLYSRINVSLRTMDIIIAVIVILIIAALAVGIFYK